MLTIGHSIASSVFCSKSEAPLQKAMLQQTFVLFLSIQAHLALESEDFSVCTSLDGKSGQRREEQLRVFFPSPRESSLLLRAVQ